MQGCPSRHRSKRLWRRTPFVLMVSLRHLKDGFIASARSNEKAPIPGRRYLRKLGRRNDVRSFSCLVGHPPRSPVVHSVSCYEIVDTCLIAETRVTFISRCVIFSTIHTSQIKFAFFATVSFTALFAFTRTSTILDFVTVAVAVESALWGRAMGPCTK